MDIKVQNIVASVVTNETFDLNMISKNLVGSEYSPQKFPGLIYRLKDPKIAILVFTSGKLIVTGAKTFENVYEAVDKFRRNLKKIGVNVQKDPKIEIHNIVATSDLHGEVNLSQVAITLGMECVEYEPEQFPGLVYRVRDPKAVALIFKTGKVVCTGTKNVEEIEIALGKIEHELRDADLIA
jgi:transcription initiation factor TFIID TATA-box-binding protein